MRMKKLVVGLLVLGLAVSVVGMVGFAGNGNGHNNDQSGSVDDQVSWTVGQFIEITIAHEAFDFGQIVPGTDTVTEEGANTLYVQSNTSWALNFSVSGNGSDYLGVALSGEGGTGDADVTVDYTLSGLRSMDPGSYIVTVTYTATAK